MRPNAFLFDAIPIASVVRTNRVKSSLRLTIVCISLIFLSGGGLHAQIPPGVYLGESEEGRHELKITEDYWVLSVYQEEPPGFIKTLGGFYEISDGILHSELEFNSAYESDSVRKIALPVEVSGETVTLGGEVPVVLKKAPALAQPLDGLWLFASRGPDEGQERRGEANTRKTLKFLIDGRFQWIAYDTADMKFSGTGGGSYEASEGRYTEHIGYFSRDNSRVGATLNFDYEVQGNDWHHMGKNSRGEPMYEIWAKRGSGQ